MNAKGSSNGNIGCVRRASRVHCLREITLTYEGQNERIFVKAPDLSASGMFISTSRPFAEGTVLNLRFRLAVTNAEVHTRGEVRYCLPGVGVGVEFIGIGPQAAKDIARELALNSESPRSTKKAARRSRAPRRR
jgi:PilZ domain